MSGCGIKSIQKRLRSIFGKEVAHVTRADVREAREILENAAYASDLVLPYAQRIARELGLNAETAVKMGPLKKLDRIFEKAIGKLDGHLQQVPDVGRLRILIEKPEDVIALRNMFLNKKRVFQVQHPTNEVTVSEFQDNFWEPSKSGRVAIHLGLDVSLSGSQKIPFEIQIIHKDMQDTELLTHSNYEKASALERKAKLEGREMTAEEAEAYAAYHQSNKEVYHADVLSLGLYSLRSPHLQPRQESHLSLAA